jgi:predicted Zn-dependent peptidase
MVNTPQTAAALKEILAILRGFSDSITEAQLDAARRAIRRKAARGYETNVQCLEHLLSIQYSQQPDDEFDNWMGKVDALTLADVRGALARHIDTGHLVIVVTGDAAAIRSGLGDIGLGAVIDIDGYGNVIEKPKADK